MTVFQKKFIRISLSIGIILIIAFASLHFWFKYNASNFLQSVVHDKSNGKLKLEVKGFTFNYLNNYIEIRKASLSSTDTLSQSATYNVEFSKLSLRITSFWPLLRGKLLLDSVKIFNPDIRVTRWRPDTIANKKTVDVSIPQEMGKMYNSLLDALDAFGIKRVLIDNGRFTAINKMKPQQEPVVVSNIFLNLVRTAGDTEERDEYVKGRQTVELQTYNQTIALPGGRHILSFKKFNLQLFKKHIQIDSCTVTALPTDTSNSTYKIFFNKLLLVGVDFNAMYENNLIRADSVYCESPVFNIQIDRSDLNVTGKKKEKPDPEKILRDITGDLELAFVGVKGAGIHIDIIGGKKRSLFNSNKDDFALYGLRINADSSKPVVVDRFDMLVRDYRLYNADSSSAFSFDSIHFKNNRIVLSNFSVVTTSSRYGLHNERDFIIPYFELTGLNWSDLIFEETLRAHEAVLYNPVINYTKKKPSKKRRKTNFFHTLQTLDDMMVLDKIKVINGTINMKMGAAAFNLQNANLQLNSSHLLESENIKDLRSAIENLSFSNGIIRIKDNIIRLQNVRHTANNVVEADKMNIRSTSNKLNGSATNITVKNMLLDDEAETIVVDGIGWKNAQIAIRSSAPSGKNKSATGNVMIKNISGSNTKLNFITGKTNITTNVSSLKIASLNKPSKSSMQIEGLLINGNHLSMKSGSMQVNASDYQISSDRPSYLSQFHLTRLEPLDSIEVQSPRINFLADINSILAKDIHLFSVETLSPVIKISKWSSDIKKDSSKQQPSIRIDRIFASTPSVYVATHRTDSVSIINIPKSDNSFFEVSNLTMDEGITEIGTLTLNTTSGTFIKRSGETLGVEKGKVDVQLSNIRLSNTNGKPAWSALITSLYLQNPNNFLVGAKKNMLSVNEASAGNVQLSSDVVTDFNKLVRLNVSAWLRTATGQYVDSTTTLKWYNAAYDYKNRTLSLDSFNYHPTQTRDSVIAHTPHQTDYITLKTGPLKITDFNLEKYNKDSAFIAQAISITKPLITIYRDKRPPFLHGAVKPLPVDMIKSIAVPVSLQRVNINDGLLTYTEVNAKTGAEGTVLLTHINGGLSNIKNSNISNTDSLTLAINAYLMDSTLVNLRVKESYTDTLSGFLMTLRMKPTSLGFLNPVLAPLSNIKIVSGTIDSLHLRAIGREHIALGEMKMYYHNLRIQLIKDGDPDKTSFLRNVASFLANTLVIKKNNSGRTGLVYFQRLRDRSFFNYIIKMTFSGMATSVGVKKNKKYLKQYRQELKDQKLPPIEFE
ncbi:MAG: hypothetical protein ABR502_01660 [Chitinophagaceae bacterium]